MRSMRRVVSSALVLAAAAFTLAPFLPGCSTAPKTVEAPIPAVMLPDLKALGLTQSWQRHLDMAAGEHVERAWRIGKSIYVVTDQGRLSRVDAKSGVLGWSTGLGDEVKVYRPVEIRAPEAASANQVLVLTLGHANLLDFLTGDAQHHGPLGLSITSNPVLVGNTICVGAGNSFEFLSRDHFTRLFRIPSPGDSFVSSPVPIDKTVIIASMNGHLWRVDSTTGLWTWKDRKTNGQVIAGLAADGRAVYVPCLDQRLYAFDVESGSELWQSQLQGTLDQTPALGEGIVMVVAGGQGLYAVNRADGIQRWKADGVTSVATVSNDHVWVGDSAGNLKSISLDTGAVLASAPIPEAKLFVRNADDDTIFLVNRTGTVGAYKPH